MRDGVRHRHEHRFEISLGTMVRALAIIAAIWLLSQVWITLLLIVCSLLLVGTLNPIIGRLERRGMRRGWAIATIFLGLLGILTLMLVLTVPALLSQVVAFAEQLPSLKERVAQFLEQSSLTRSFADTVRGFDPRAHLARIDTIGLSQRVLTLVGYGITIIFLALYLIADRARARGALYAVVPRRYHLRLARILLNLEVIVGGYIRGQVITSALIAVFFWLLLTAFQVPGALALAMFAALTDVLPFIGAILATTPAVLATLQARGTTMAIVVLGAIIVYQEIENRIIVPRVYGRALRLPAAAVIVALMIGAQLMGMMGALLSLPIAAALRMMVQELRVELPGDDTDATAMRRRDQAAEERYDRLTRGEPASEAARVAAEIAARIHDEEPPPDKH